MKAYVIVSSSILRQKIHECQSWWRSCAKASIELSDTEFCQVKVILASLANICLEVQEVHIPVGAYRQLQHLQAGLFSQLEIDTLVESFT